MLGSRKNSYAGFFFLGIAALLLIVNFYFSFRAGCVFDGKQLTGGIEALKISEKYSSISTIVASASFVSIFAGIYVLVRRNIQATLAVFLLVFTFGVPFTWWLSLEASIRGTQTCNPS